MASFKAFHEVHYLKLGKLILQFYLNHIDTIQWCPPNPILNNGKIKKSCGTEFGEKIACGTTITLILARNVHIDKVEWAYVL